MAALQPRATGCWSSNTERSRFRARRPSAHDGLEPRGRCRRARSSGSSPGPSPADALRRLTRPPGRQPTAAAPWFFGPWYQPHRRGAERSTRSRRLREADVPASAANTYLHYLPCGDQRGHPRPSSRAHRRLPRARLRGHDLLQPDGLHRLPAGVRPSRRSAALLTKTAAGTPYALPLLGQHRRRCSSSASSTSPASRADAAVYGEPARRGGRGTATTAGWRTSASTRRSDSRSANGMAGDEMHNLYPVLYHRSSHRVRARRRSGRSPASSARAGPACTPTRSSSGAATRPRRFGFDGLESAVTQAL